MTEQHQSQMHASWTSNGDDHLRTMAWYQTRVARENGTWKRTRSRFYLFTLLSMLSGGTAVSLLVRGDIPPAILWTTFACVCGILAFEYWRRSSHGQDRWLAHLRRMTHSGELQPTDGRWEFSIAEGIVEWRDLDRGLRMQYPAHSISEAVLVVDRIALLNGRQFMGSLPASAVGGDAPVARIKAAIAATPSLNADGRNQPSHG